MEEVRHGSNVYIYCPSGKKRQSEIICILTHHHQVITGLTFHDHIVHHASSENGLFPVPAPYLVVPNNRQWQQSCRSVVDSHTNHILTNNVEGTARRYKEEILSVTEILSEYPEMKLIRLHS